jgi:hypothetical protein
MKTAQRTIATVLAAGVMTLALAIGAEPRPGGAMPGFSARDLAGNWHHSHELRGRRTLVLAISGPSASGAARAWFDAARSRLAGGGVHIVTIVALDLPFYAPDYLVRGRARAEAPRDRWHDTWLDRNGDIQRAFGLRHDSGMPWAFALDETGRVVAYAHAPVSHPLAQSVWAALSPTVAASH